MTTPPARSTVVTTSWDDGDPLDLKLAEMLTTAGIAATFYVPIHREGHPLMTPLQLRDLQAVGVEIGSHTVNHVEVTRIPAATARREIAESKDRLEQILQNRVTSFCYPNGSFSAATAALVAESGYESGRTTVGLRTGTRFDRYRMPVTFQVYPHTRGVHVRHALKGRNLSGLAAWVTRMGAATDLSTLTARLLQRLRADGGVLHLWGHSWELEEAGLWDVTRTLVELLAGQEAIRYLTNGELVRFLGFERIGTP